MTPEEIATQSAAIQQALAELGVSPEQALLAEGRQRAWSRFDRAYTLASERGQTQRTAAIEARVERDAATHARREMARLGTRAAAGERPRGPMERSVEDASVGLDYGATGRPSPLAMLERPNALLGSEPPPMLPTLSGVENQGPPSPPVPPLGDRLAAMGRGLMNPLGITPPPTTVYQSPGQTLTGRQQPATPRTLTFDPSDPASGMAYDPEAQAAGGMLGFGPWFRAAQGSAQAVANVAAQAPRTTAAAAAGTALTAVPAQTQQPDPVLTAREGIARLRGEQERLQSEQARLRDASRRFDGLRTTDPAAVRQAQEELAAMGLYGLSPDGKRVQPDGRWGGGTQDAINRYRQRTEAEMATVNEQLRTIGGDLQREQSRLTGLEGGQRQRQAEQNVGPWQRAIRDYPGMIGTAAGVALGVGGRGAATWIANRGAGQRAVEAARLMTARRGDVPSRVGNVNEIWRLGGEPANVPFSVAPTAPRGYSPNPNVAPASSLFPQPSGFSANVRGPDYALMGGYALDAGLMELRAHSAAAEVAEARAAVDRDPSEINIGRLQRALDMEGFWTAAARAGQMALPAHALTSKLAPYRYPRPNVAPAEAEVMRLNQLLAPRGGPPAPAAPAAPQGPAHHSQYQPRQGGRFASGRPDYPDGDPRRQ